MKDNLQTGATEVVRNCAVTELVQLGLYGAGQTQGVAAGIEQLRNHVARGNGQIQALLINGQAAMLEDYP